MGEEIRRIYIVVGQDNTEVGSWSRQLRSIHFSKEWGEFFPHPPLFRMAILYRLYNILYNLLYNSY